MPLFVCDFPNSFFCVCLPLNFLWDILYLYSSSWSEERKNVWTTKNYAILPPKKGKIFKYLGKNKIYVELIDIFTNEILINFHQPPYSYHTHDTKYISFFLPFFTLFFNTYMDNLISVFSVHAERNSLSKKKVERNIELKLMDIKLIKGRTTKKIFSTIPLKNNTHPPSPNP